MSMKGERELQLERARREALRLEQVRGESRALLAVCNETIAGVRDAAVQQYAAAELRELVSALNEAGARVQEAPDAALERIQGLQQRLTSALAAAQARSRAWSEAQVQAQARLEALAGRIEAVTAAQKHQTGPELEEARRRVQDARTHAGRGAEAEARQCLEQAEQALDSARAASLEEKVRKEVVRGLLTTLKEMGFVIVGPTLSADIVILEGRLPSGRRARFEVKVDGQMSFDLDGYEGRTCAQEMEKVETAMHDRFGVTLGPPQVVWKNPDRLSQGALELPGGNRSRGGQ
ncbi:hypothetical protein [Myxococcus sp. AS-1-15]|uniref:hypothetical protein n=1 Tax=Myxococcus TaxID=32 RepID=UPI001CBC2026|nr:hypothetical protein [Myxococcus sp. AS-1-15]MBZ4402221.1 hypothetical protein [Myxococcus sp. AS-1-15]